MKQLALHVGPLARVLIKRATHESGDMAQLVHTLAEHIDSESERRECLDSRR